MRTLSRTTFMIAANLVWFGQFTIAFLGPEFSDFLLWRRVFTPSTQVGCVGDTYVYAPLDRLYLLGLIWLLSAPLMTLIAWRHPRDWPRTLARVWWKRSAGAWSGATLMAALAVALWPLFAVTDAPVASAMLLAGMRAAGIFVVALYYRAVLLSA